MFFVCIGISRGIDKQFFTFFEGNSKQTQFYISQATIYTLHLCKKNSWTLLKNMTLENILKLGSPQRKRSFNDVFRKKKHHRNSYITLGSEESQVIIIAMHKIQPSLHIKNPQKQLNIKIQKRSKIRFARELTVCASWRWNPRRSPENGSQ